MQHVKNANRRKCNENVENASECIKMHKNAYGKKLHHFRGKTTLIPARARARFCHFRLKSTSSRLSPSHLITASKP